MKTRRRLSILLVLAVVLIPALAFGQVVPEKLIYELSWLGIPVGSAIQEITQEAGERWIVSRARSNDWLSVFFPVQDRTESVLSVAGAPFPGVTRRYMMQIHEGKTRRFREIVFDQKRGIAHYLDHRSGERRDILIPACTYDVYGSFYYVRHIPLEVGHSVPVTILDGQKVETIEVRVLRKEMLATRLGELPTIVIQPMVKSEGIFEGKGQVLIWLTDDSRRIPVKAETQVTVGSVTATLVGGSYFLPAPKR